ncbi:hypothetical protein G3I59_36680 [Amycolatopsis rubida]|uniref:Minor tail protein n=1 Tax=Amycolatopsis rubida TaxID=112413 RepID=A0ABX0C7V3_9PSEU|nr:MULTISPECIES: hypothetical protein [Amycolatopsis]MYW95997.1 hypothetical protein [Amycolatopsis rubida]NEC60988.1 hypothetical protein [Amycolatopsis rubida]OAP20572.1 hypothetical protein A4R44_08732 [Amycolatopsis sp. M39]
MNVKMYSTGTIAGADVAQYSAGMILSTIEFPDPGYAYQLSFFGQVWVAPGSSTGVDVTIKDGTSLAGKILSGITSIDGGMVGNQGGRIPRPVSGTSPTLTGGRSVSLAIAKWKGGNLDGWQHGNEQFTRVTAFLTAA